MKKRISPTQKHQAGQNRLNLNATADTAPQPKGKQFSWFTQKINYTAPLRGEKDMLSYKEALAAAESVYWPSRRQLYNLYADICLDGFLAGITNKLFDAILNKTLLYKHKDEQIEEMNDLIGSQAFSDLCREILMTKMWGITGIEVIPGASLTWNSIDRRYIKPKWRKITYDQDGNDGISYDDYWNIWVVGNNQDLGLYLSCAYYVLLKRNVISNWADFIEMYGLPTTVMKYAGYDEQTRNELRDIVQNGGSALQLVIPKEADHELHDSKNTSNGDVQDKFRKMANEEMAVLILGATETTTSTSRSGGKTQSTTHQGEQKEKIKALMKYLVNQLNDPVFINILQKYGYPVRDGARFIFDREVDVEYMAKKKDIDTAMIESGLPVTEEYLYRTYAIDKPAAGETIIGNGSIPTPKYREKLPTKYPEELSRQRTQKHHRHSPSKLRNLLNALTDFFAQAR